MNQSVVAYSYLNENALYHLNKLEEGIIDALRAQSRAKTKSIYAKEMGIYYTYKNGKLFFFFNKNAFGPSILISNIIDKILNKIARFILGDKVTQEEIKKLKHDLEIKDGADVHDVRKVINYYITKKELDAVRYNKMCNTWSYLIIPGIKGAVFEKILRKILNIYNGQVFPKDVLKHPEIIDKIDEECKKGKKDKKGKK